MFSYLQSFIKQLNTQIQTFNNLTKNLLKENLSILKLIVISTLSLFLISNYYYYKKYNNNKTIYKFNFSFINYPQPIFYPEEVSNILTKLLKNLGKYNIFIKKCYEFLLIIFMLVILLFIVFYLKKILFMLTKIKFCFLMASFM